MKQLLILVQILINPNTDKNPKLLIKERKLCKTHNFSRLDQSTVSIFVFTNIISLTEDYLTFVFSLTTGVAHGQELQYLFGFPYFTRCYREMSGVYPRQDYSYGDQEISEMMITLFTNFTMHGWGNRNNNLHSVENITWESVNPL